MGQTFNNEKAVTGSSVIGGEVAFGIDILNLFCHSECEESDVMVSKSIIQILRFAQNDKSNK